MGLAYKFDVYKDRPRMADSSTYPLHDYWIWPVCLTKQTKASMFVYICEKSLGIFLGQDGRTLTLSICVHMCVPYIRSNLL